MTQTRVLIGGALLGVLACVLLAGLLILGMGPATAAPASMPVAAAPTATESVQAPAAPDTQQHYADLLVQNFATQLGVDPARLNAAFTAAANSTIDQAVHDGQLSPDAAVKARAEAGQGLAAILRVGLTAGQDKSAAQGPGDNGEMQAGVDAVLPALAPLFGLTPAQLTDALRSGQSLSALEQAHHVSDQQVRDAALAAVRAALNAGVGRGQWSQAAADKTYQVLSANIDNFLLKISGSVAKPSDSGRELDNTVFRAVEIAVAGVLGLPVDQLYAALGTQSLQALEQAHKVTDGQVRAAATAAARTEIAAGVGRGQWTQAQADAYSQDLPRIVDGDLLKLTDESRTQGLFQAMEAAVAQLLGLTRAQFLDALKAGQSLATLQQAHHITDGQLHDAALAAARAEIAAGLQNGHWTQAQADAFAPSLSDMVDKILGKLKGGPAATPTAGATK